MTRALLGLAWIAVVAGGFVRHRPPPARLDALRRPIAPLARRRLAPAARAAIAFVLPLPLMPSLGGVVAGALAAGATTWLPTVQRRRAEARRLARLESELPEVVDLLVLAVGAGLTVPLALDAVSRRAGGALAAELGRALAASRQGHRLADALDEVPGRAGDGVRPLVAALVAAERYGAPLRAGLDRLALEARATRRRHADEAARRVSVKLLFPLVLCILPAFALLTVAPLIAGALRSLRL